MQAVRALVPDTKKKIPGIGISIKPYHKNQGHFKQYDRNSTEPIILSLVEDFYRAGISETKESDKITCVHRV